MAKLPWAGKRRGAAHRVAPKTARPRAESIVARLRRNSNWLRLLIVAVVGVLLVLVVDGSGPSFTFRLGQRPDRDVTVKIGFARVDKTETENQRRQAARDEPPVLTNDPAKVLAVGKALGTLLAAVAKAESIEKLPAGMADEWKLSAAGFKALHGELTQPEQLEAVRQRVQQALALVAEVGVLDRGTLRREPGQRLPEQVRLVSAKTGEADRLMPIERVNLVNLRDADHADNPLASLRRGLAPAAADVLFALVVGRLEPSMTLDQEATEAARRAARARVADVKIPYEPGAGGPLVVQGRPIGAEELELLKLEHEAFLASLSPTRRLERLGSIAVLVAMMLALMGVYVHRSEPMLGHSVVRVLSTGLLIVVTVALCRLFSTDPWHAQLLPLMMTAMMTTLAYSPLFALQANTCLVLLTCVALGSSLGGLIAALATTTSATLFLGRVRNRLTLVRVGTSVGLVAAVASYAAGTLEHVAFSLLVGDTVRALACGVVTGFLISGSLPFIEKLFDVTTDISLLELSDVSHPLLQQLVQKAPGTYSHCNTIASLAEAAADAIGANGLLCRVGSYYHDIGKVVKPQYFAENQGEAGSRHSSLAPAMSTLIIIGHVKDGVDLARQYGLPDRVIRFIEEHHGTTLVEFFYHEAAKRQGAKQQVEESLFRYPGPKPSSKETAILMLCDAVESAARTLSEPNPGSIESLVDKMVSKRLNEGQLDESGLTLTEVKLIKESLVKSLIGVYHGRVKYPAAERA